MTGILLKNWRATSLQFLKFGFIGGLGFLVDSAMLYFGIYVLGLGRIAAGIFSFPFAVSATWIGNRSFTFRDNVHMPAIQQLARFSIVCAVGLIFNRGTYSLLVSFVPFVYEHPIIGLLAGSLVGMFFNFYFARKHVFGGHA